MTIKEEVHRVVDELPETATWDDILFELHTHRQVALGMQDVDEDRTVSHEDAKREFLK